MHSLHKILLWCTRGHAQVYQVQTRHDNLSWFSFSYGLPHFLWNTYEAAGVLINMLWHLLDLYYIAVSWECMCYGTVSPGILGWLCVCESVLSPQFLKHNSHSHVAGDLQQVWCLVGSVMICVKHSLLLLLLNMWKSIAFLLLILCRLGYIWWSVCSCQPVQYALNVNYLEDCVCAIFSFL